MNLNDFAKEVHENAVAHGWWDEPRSDGTLRSLMHAELSEALEEYRANRPMVWHLCKHGGMCENQDVHCGQVGCDTCTPEQRKPEGIAVELLDFAIRALDTMEAKNVTFNLPDFVDGLHSITAIAGTGSWNVLAVGVLATLAWIQQDGIDPVALMLEKHEYNKTRSYKHGGKVC